MLDESLLHIYKSTIQPFFEYYCQISSGAPSVYLEILDKLQRSISNIIGPNLTYLYQSLSYHRHVASLCLYYKYFHANCFR